MNIVDDLFGWLFGPSGYKLINITLDINKNMDLESSNPSTMTLDSSLDTPNAPIKVDTDR